MTEKEGKKLMCPFRSDRDFSVNCAGGRCALWVWKDVILEYGDKHEKGICSLNYMVHD